jgi:predicted transcriptional regulator
MKPFCEVVVFEILPAVRAMVARELMEKYHITQNKAAWLLGVSQPAVSQYKRDLRGFKTELFSKNPGLRAMVERIAEGMASGEIKDFQATLSFCELCKEIRFSGAGCESHKSGDPSKGQCSICQDHSEFYGKPKSKKTSTMGKIKKLSRF